MIKKCLSLLVMAALLLSALGVAQAEELYFDEANTALADEIYAGVMDQPTEAAQVAYLLNTAAANEGNAVIEIFCAQMIYFVDTTGAYMEEIDGLLRKSLAHAEGDNRPIIVQQVAEWWLMYGELDDAVALLTEAVESSPELLDLQVTLAEALYYDGQPERAFAMLEDILQDEPTHFNALNTYALVLLEDCQWDEALAAFERLSAAYPNDFSGLVGEFATLIASGEFEQGVRIMDMLLGAGGTDELWLERARVRLWKQYLPEAALSESDALLRMTPGWTDAAVVKMVALMMLERYGEAAEVAADIAEDTPSYGEMLGALVLMDDGRWAEAEAALDALIARDGTYPSAYKNLSVVRLQGYDDVDGAMEAMREAFAITGGEGDTDMMQQLGRVYIRQGEYLEAARCFYIADQLSYDDPSSLYLLAMTCIDAGQPEALRETVAEMERRYPGWYETMLARTLMHDMFDEFDLALASYGPLKEKFPFPTSSLGDLEGMLMADNGDADGLALIEAAIAEDEENGQLWDSYAYALVALGDYDGAQEALDKAEALLPEPTGETAGLYRASVITLEAARAYLLMEQGDPEGALQALLRASECGWSMHAMLFSDEYDILRDVPGYDELVATQPPHEEDWDVTQPPTVPGFSRQQDT